MGTLIDQATTEAALRAAWEEILANDRADGVLGPSVTHFAREVDVELGKLHDELTSGTYRPRPLTRVEIPKPDGGVRVLAIPPARDRVVERAVATVLVGIVDPVLGPSAFGYRPGLGVADAVQAIAGLRDEGLRWVLRADVDDCFPNIDTARLHRILATLLDEPATSDFVLNLLDRPVAGPGGLRPARGLPQGAPLSPMLSNLALEHLDERLRQARDSPSSARSSARAIHPPSTNTGSLTRRGDACSSDGRALTRVSRMGG